MRKKKLLHGKRLLAGLLAASMVFGLNGAFPEGEKVYAAQSGQQVLTVDLKETTGDILHGAAGFLYGVSNEGVPTTNTMVPLKPKVLCTKGALGTEHPYGDALDVAESFFESGGEQVMMYNSNYYGVFGVTANYKDYAKVLKETIAPAVVEWKNEWKQKHANDNLSAVDIDKALIYIPINEGTPKNGASFEGAWEAYFDAIREADPAAEIAGPNSCEYDLQFENEFDPQTKQRTRKFIQYCANNDCMPDIVTWHDLQTDKLQRLAWEMDDFRDIWATTDWTQYKKDHPEEFPGGAAVPEIPQICINEYADFSECGVPGRLVNWIARMEDQKIYGCLPFWHQANNLNDLTADANEGNGAWWLYKWYGDMSGKTVKVSTSTSYEKLYGVASVDDTKRIATTLLGGVDGKADVSLLHVNETGAFAGAKNVHVKVQSTAYSGYHGAKEGTVTVLEGTYPVNEDGSVRITLDNMKFSTAYNVTLTEEAEGNESTDLMTNAYQRVYEAEQAGMNKTCSLKGTGDFNPPYYLSDNRSVAMPTGAVLTYKFDVPVAGKYRLDFIYGNGTGSYRNDMNRHSPQNVAQSFSIDGAKADSVVMENTLLDNMTGIKTRYADLEAGSHTVQIKTIGNGSILHDSMTVTWCGAKDQDKKTVNQRFEAELADFNILLANKDTKVKTETQAGGYSGNGYVTGLHERSVKAGGGIRWNVTVAQSGIYNLTFRYQAAKDGKLNLYVGNTATTLKDPDTMLALKNTANAWNTASVSMYLQKGINIVDVDTTNAASLDYMQVQAVTAMDNLVYETTVEAEDCIPAGSSIRTAASKGASGGKYVVGMEGASSAENDKNKYLEFKYTAPKAGVYQMRIYQSNNDICGSHTYNTKIIDKYASVRVNGGTADRYFFINTFSDDTFKEKTVPVTLKAGENTIRIYNDDSWHVLWGGTQALPGTNELKNYAPNFDKFVIMPFVLEDTIVLAQEYGIQLAATSGGYATVDKNTVAKGGEFNVTIVPNQGNDLRDVSVDGATAKAQKQADGSYALKIANVQKDVDVQIAFEESNTEHQNRYIRNAGFGTGNTDKWTAQGAQVKSSAADSFEGYYAILGSKGSLAQTVSLQPGIYELSVYSKGKGSVLGDAVLRAAGVTANLNKSQDYTYNTISFEMKQAGNVTIEADATGLTAGNILLDNFSLEEKAAQESNVSKKHLYLVDCGDYDPSTVGAEEKFGKYNGVTDQVYQKDLLTGKTWGVLTTTDDPQIANAGSGGNAVYTKYQWANERQSGDTARTESFRYAHGQDTAGIATRYVKYRFEVEPGQYQVTVGMGNSWDNAANPDVYAGTGDSAKDVKLNTAAMNIPANGHKEVSGTVTVAEGAKALDVYALSQDPTLQMNYIDISRIKAENEQPASLEIVTKPKKLTYFVGEDLDTEGLEVKVRYKNGTEETVDASECVLEGFDNVKAGTPTVTVKYTEGATTVQAGFEVTIRKPEIAVSDDKYLKYFVDCGDFDPETTSEGDAISKNQSVTDKIYGADTTGKSWGVVTSDTDTAIAIPAQAKAGSNAAYTTYQWAFEDLAGDVSRTESFRYAHEQDKAGISPRYVKYRFEVEPGEYLVTVGMGNGWNNAANPNVYAGTGDSARDVKLNAQELGIPAGGNTEVSGKVTVAVGTTALDVYALSTEDTLQMNYIYVEDAAKEEEMEKPSRLVLTPPAKTIYQVGEKLDLTGMAVKAVYNTGKEKELSAAEYSVRDSFQPNVLGSQTIIVSYTEKDATVVAGFAVSVRDDGTVTPPPAEKKYKITYDSNKGGKVSGMPSDKKSYKKGQKLTVKGTPVSNAKFFAGWNTKANGKGKAYKAGSKITVNGNIKLYAQWKTSYTASNKLKYKVNGKKTVSCAGTANKKASSIKIPATVKYNGITYKVTAVGAKAFAGNAKIRSVSIGNNVKTIGARAFEKCKNLKSVTIGTGLTTIDKYAFSGEKKGCVITINSKRLRTVKTAINYNTKNMAVRVPRAKLKAYKTLLTRKAKKLTVKAK